MMWTPTHVMRNPPVIGPSLRRQDPIPVHEQVATHMREQMTTGVWPPHYKLRPEPDLAAELGVSRGTLRRALQTLVAEGRLARIHGKGTFVLASGPEPPLAHELIGLSEALDRHGSAYTTTVDAAGIVDPSPRIGGLLDSGHEKVFELRRHRNLEDTVVAVLVNYVRCEVVPGIDKYDYRTQRLFAAIEESGRHVGSARRTFEAQAANDERAALFGVTTGFPLLYLEQISYLADGRPVEYSDVWLRGDQMKLTAWLVAVGARSDTQE